MRTKTILTAAAGMLCAASVMAVTSVNVVGYVNKSLPAGWSILVNPLTHSPDNTVANVIPAPPEGTTIFMWDKVAQTFIGPNQFSFGVWGDPNMVLGTGDGFWISVTDPTTITFVGDVVQGPQTITLAQGWNIVGSTWPAAGGLTANLGFSSPNEGDTVYLWDAGTQTYGDGTYQGPYQFSFGAWGPQDPPIGIGTGFWLSPAPQTTSWGQNFTVQ